MEEMIRELDKIFPVVVRVHGDHHEELKEAGALYPVLRSAMDAHDTDKVKETLRKLSSVTDCFAVPEDACPTYEKAYCHLAELMKAYGA